MENKSTKVKLKTVLETFSKEFPKINEKYPIINCGGCGIFAQKVYGILKEFHFKPKLIVLIPFYYSKTDAVEKLNNNGKPYEMAWSHIMVKVGKKFIDCDGIYTNLKQTDHYFSHEGVEGMTPELLQQWIDSRGWNDRFDREKAVPIINKGFNKIEKQLSKVKEII